MKKFASVLALTLMPACSSVELASVERGAIQAEHLVFENVSVFDGTAFSQSMDVLVSGSQIAAVGSTGTVAVPAGARRIPGTGRTLLPGLVDAHTHLFSAGEKDMLPPDSDAILKAFLFAGVTSILVAAHPEDLSGQAAASLSGEALSPRLYQAGPALTAPGGHPIPLLKAMLPWPISYFVARAIPTAQDESEARERVRQIVDAFKPPFVKIIYDDLPPGSPRLSSAAMEAAISEARQLGVRPIVHASKPEDAVAAAEAGAALLVHTPQRSELSDAQVARLAAVNIPVVTTVNLISASRDLAAHGPNELERALVDPDVITSLQEDPVWNLKGFSEEVDRRHAEVAGYSQRNLQKLRAAGVPVLLGTDTGVHGVFPGSSLHRELETAVELGMQPAEALRAATSASASFLDPANSFGRIAAGQRADLLLVRGDPSVDIRALRQIESVFLGGMALERVPLR